MMAVISENTGRYDAFDVKARDLLPAGMTYVPGSLCVTNGAGDLFTVYRPGHVVSLTRELN